MLAILTALATLDSGAVTLPIDGAVYPEAAVARLAADDRRPYRVAVRAHAGASTLTIVAKDPAAARLAIGLALTDLLRLSLQARA